MEGKFIHIAQSRHKATQSVLHGHKCYIERHNKCNLNTLKQVNNELFELKTQLNLHHIHDLT